jgi:hypothetical protein
MMTDSGCTMTNSLEKIFSHSEAHYRIIYLRPNPYSDEALTVGIVLKTDSSTVFHQVPFDGANSAIVSLLGENGREQTAFALEAVRKAAEERNLNLETLESGSDILSIGAIERARCDDPDQFSRDLLEISSCLCRSFRAQSNEYESITQDQVNVSLYNTLTKIDAFKATRLFKGLKVNLGPNSSTSSIVKIPISGDHVIGGPVSFVTKQVGSARTQAEAAIARFSLAARQVNKKPAIYVLTPSSELKAKQDDVDKSIAEIRAVAVGHGVIIRHERSYQELAKALLRDDAA